MYYVLVVIWLSWNPQPAPLVVDFRTLAQCEAERARVIAFYDPAKFENFTPFYSSCAKK